MLENDTISDQSFITYNLSPVHNRIIYDFVARLMERNQNVANMKWHPDSCEFLTNDLYHGTKNRM